MNEAPVKEDESPVNEKAPSASELEGRLREALKGAMPREALTALLIAVVRLSRAQGIRKKTVKAMLLRAWDRIAKAEP